MKNMKPLRNDPILKQRRKELRHKETEAERIFWSYVREKQFQNLKFYRQYSVGPYILDFYCPSIQLAIELDGGHHNDTDNKIYDAERTEYLKELKIEVLRFSNNEVLEDAEDIFEKINVFLNPPLGLRGGQGGRYES